MTDSRKLFEGLRVPVIGAPMFLVSGPELVIEQCKAGIIGSFPALNARPQELLETWLTQIEDALAKHRRENPGAKVAPYGVNLIVNPANKRLEQDFEVCVRHKVPLIITSLSAPTAIAKRVHEYGGIVFHDVIKVRHAEKALEAGVDGIILVCARCGRPRGPHQSLRARERDPAHVRRAARARRRDHQRRRRARRAGDGLRRRLHGHALHRDARVSGGRAL